MMKTLLHYAKSLLQAVIIFIFLSLIVDWVRKPDQPLQSAAQTLTLTDGQTTSLQSFSQNRVAIVYFWGSWCGICRHTSPVIQRLHEDGVPVLGVALRSGSRQEVRDYLQQHHWTFDTLNDEHGDWSQAWQVKVTPTIVLVQQGKVIHSTTGLASYWGLKLRVALADA